MGEATSTTPLGATMTNLDSVFRTIVHIWAAHEDAVKSGNFEAMIDTKQRLDAVRHETRRLIRAA